MNKETFDIKWKKFKYRSGLFFYIPFIEFALAAGSMATGRAKEDSDFDVTVGVKGGRIFTARFFAIIFFELRGWRRKGVHGADERKKTADKICLSHFITENRYRLSPPYNEYWDNLYRSLVPLYGNKNKIGEFFKENDWVSGIFKNFDIEIDDRKSIFKRTVELVLGGFLGDFVERLLKNIQVKRIEKSMGSVDIYKPRIIYNDDELEFHPHTERIEDFSKSLRLLARARDLQDTHI